MSKAPWTAARRAPGSNWIGEPVKRATASLATGAMSRTVGFGATAAAVVGTEVTARSAAPIHAAARGRVREPGRGIRAISSGAAGHQSALAIHRETARPHVMFRASAL